MGWKGTVLRVRGSGPWSLLIEAVAAMLREDPEYYTERPSQVTGCGYEETMQRRKERGQELTFSVSKSSHSLQSTSIKHGAFSENYSARNPAAFSTNSLALNAVIILLDLSLLILQLVNLHQLQVSLKPAIYSINLKLEFADRPTDLPRSPRRKQ